MIIVMNPVSASAAERRMIRLFKTFGPNLKEYGRDLMDTYVAGPVKSKDPVQMVMGTVGGAMSVVLEGTDAVWSGIVDEPLERPEGLVGRTRRDLKLLLQNNIVHPIRSIGNIWRLLTSDIPMDFIDTVGGFHQGYRSRMASVLQNREVPVQMAA